MQRNHSPLVSKPVIRTVYGLAVLALLFSFAAVFVGFHHSLLDFHGFRQTQTAISAYSLTQRWNLLHYETPLLGPPWSIPFEFPLYQGIVAVIVRAFGFPMNETGRAVSLTFFYLSFLPLASILHKLRLRTVQIAAVLAMLAVSPIYLFWSRTFMIESTALFFSVMYVEQTVRLALLERPWRSWAVAGAVVFGSLAALVKVTTFAPYLLLGCGLMLWSLWTMRKRGTLAAPRLVALASCIVLPVVAGAAWTTYADAEKARNPLGIHLTSHALREWNYGTLAQRLQLHNYLDLVRAARNPIGSLALVIVTLLLFYALVRRWNLVAVVALALYAIPQIIFFNLYVVHDYYPYSCALCLVVAVGALIGDLIALPGRRAWTGVVMLALVMAACAVRYRQYYYPLASRVVPGRADVARMIDDTTQPDGVLLITGLDWSAELPYQSHRRAIMDFNKTEPARGLGPIHSVIQNEGPEHIAAVVACAKQRSGERLQELLVDSGMARFVEMHGNDCDIYERRP